MKNWVYRNQSCNKISSKDSVGSLSMLSCLAGRLSNKRDDCRCNREVSPFTLLNIVLKSCISALVSILEFLCNSRQVASILYKSLCVWHIFSSDTEHGGMQNSWALSAATEGNENRSLTSSYGIWQWTILSHQKLYHNCNSCC